MPGDLIAFIGTQDEPTEPEDQGRLLGLAEIGRLPIDSLEVLDPANIRSIAVLAATPNRLPTSTPRPDVRPPAASNARRRPRPKSLWTNFRMPAKALPMAAGKLLRTFGKIWE
jgi:hypothetical protein